MIDTIDYGKLLQTLTRSFALGANSIHGPSHWKRVEEIGVLLAPNCGADLTVVKLFALFHDSCRMNDGEDPDHGKLGANLAETMRGTHFTLDDTRFESLKFACIWHTSGKVSKDPTIGACWDADRLDLPRCGIWPDPKFLSTVMAKNPKTISWAMSISRRA